MTGACFTWLDSVPLVWVPCTLWQLFPQVFLWEVLENDFGKWPPWLLLARSLQIPKRTRVESHRDFPAPPRADPRTDRRDLDLSHTCGMSGGLEVPRVLWLPDSSGPERSSDFHPVCSHHTSWDFHTHSASAGVLVDRIWFHLPHSILIFSLSK